MGKGVEKIMSLKDHRVMKEQRLREVKEEIDTCEAVITTKTNDIISLKKEKQRLEEHVVMLEKME